MSIKHGTHKCGFCLDDAHERCPSGVRNGDQVTIITCGCGCERSKQRRCLVCGNREQDDVDPEFWRCLDESACQARINKMQAENPLLQQIRSQAQAREERAEVEQAAKAQTRPSRAPRTTSGACKCCGEPTKGGKFLPGHDSKYLNLLVEHHKGGDGTARQAAYDVSPAFGGKFDKRTAA